MLDAASISKNAVARIASLCAGLAGVATSEWGSFLGFSRGYFCDEPPEARQVCCFPMRTTIVGEVVRLYGDFSNVELSCDGLLLALRDHLAPLSVGGLRMMAEKAPEGIVILLGDYR